MSSSTAPQPACHRGTITGNGPPGTAHLAHHSNVPRAPLTVSRDFKGESCPGPQGCARDVVNSNDAIPVMGTLQRRNSISPTASILSASRKLPLLLERVQCKFGDRHGTVLVCEQ